MNRTVDLERPPRRMRLLGLVRKEPDWSAMTVDDVAAVRDAQQRTVESGLAKMLIGRPDRGATIAWQDVELAGRRIKVRVYRPTSGGGPDTSLPLVLHVHGGGFADTARQCTATSSGHGDPRRRLAEPRAQNSWAAVDLSAQRSGARLSVRRTMMNAVRNLQCTRDTREVPKRQKGRLTTESTPEQRHGKRVAP